MIIAIDLSDEQKCQLQGLLKKNKKSIVWKVYDIKGIDPTICMHMIILEENANNSIESQRMLNPIMKDVMKKEIIKLLNAQNIYPISDRV